LTAADAGKNNQRIPDDQVLAFAKEHQRCVVTLNRRDFIRLHISNNNHDGIIVCTQDSDT
jgi:predicted nuclease of predicted toxin-antitoxin system